MSTLRHVSQHTDSASVVLLRHKGVQLSSTGAESGAKKE